MCVKTIKSKNFYIYEPEFVTDVLVLFSSVAPISAIISDLARAKGK